jgi:hypothetical protein
MAKKIDLEQLAEFLSKSKKDRKKKRKQRKKRVKKEKYDITNKTITNRPDETILPIRRSIVQRLGIKENIVRPDIRYVEANRTSWREVDADGKKIITKKSEDGYERLKKTAEGGYGTLIYQLQRDVRDLANRIPPPVPYGQRGTDKLDIQSGIQRQVEPLRTEVKSLKTELKKAKLTIGEPIKLDVEEPPPLFSQFFSPPASQQSEEMLIDLTDRSLRETVIPPQTARKKKITIVGDPITITEGNITFAEGMRNPVDIGGGGGMPPLPTRVEPTPFWRSTSDRIERPSLREVLSEGSAFFTQPYQTEETIAELPQEEPQIEPEQVALLDEQVAVAPEPSPKKKGGRPKGSKNKPKGDKAE